MAYYTGPRRKKKIDPSIVRRRTTAEDFENTLSRAKVDENHINPHSVFKTINGIPHKLKEGKWIPLTKI
jgi:hypothetical protein